MKLQILFLIVSFGSIISSSCNSPLEDENTTENFVFKPIFSTKNKNESYKNEETETDVFNENDPIIEILDEHVTVCDITIKLQKLDIPEIDAVKITGEVLENNNTDENGGWEWILNSSTHGNLWGFESSPNYAEIVIKKSDIEFLLNNDDANTLMFSFNFFSKECLGTDEFPVSPTIDITNEKDDPLKIIDLL